MLQLLDQTYNLIWWDLDLKSKKDILPIPQWGLYRHGLGSGWSNLFSNTYLSLITKWSLVKTAVVVNKSSMVSTYCGVYWKSNTVLLIWPLLYQTHCALECHETHQIKKQRWKWQPRHRCHMTMQLSSRPGNQPHKWVDEITSQISHVTTPN